MAEYCVCILVNGGVVVAREYRTYTRSACRIDARDLMQEFPDIAGDIIVCRVVEDGFLSLA
jgi:hypothetical protein